jgi:hypothetical protein
MAAGFVRLAQVDTNGKTAVRSLSQMSGEPHKDRALRFIYGGRAGRARFGCKGIEILMGKSSFQKIY